MYVCAYIYIYICEIPPLTSPPLSRGRQPQEVGPEASKHVTAELAAKAAAKAVAAKADAMAAAEAVAEGAIEAAAAAAVMVLSVLGQSLSSGLRYCCQCC